MKQFVLLLMLGLMLVGSSASAQQKGVFPYPFHTKTLPNGLRVIVVKTDYPNIVSLQIPVFTGSRNEIEPGKSGFAHFFEHMMFRGTEKYSPEAYNEILKNAGADQNAYTTDDYTNYHTTFSKSDLETVLMLEADRFQNLKYSEAAFRTEAKTILGEYNKNAASPERKLSEVQRDAAFQRHTYKHTTMGFLKDIEAMPNQYQYSLQFFDRYYRPENTAIVVAGDVDPNTVFGLVEKYWGAWKRGNFKANIPAEPAPQAPIYKHVKWDLKTLPLVSVAFRGPAFDDRGLDVAALDLIERLAFSETSPLYEKLVLREQKVQELYASFPYRKDPYLLTVVAQVKSPADVWYVRDEILKAFAKLRMEPVSASKLQELKSNMRYGFATMLDNSEAIAEALPSVLALTRDPETINRLYERYDEVTPEVVQQVAGRFFNDQALVVTTLSNEALPGANSLTGSVDALTKPSQAKEVPIATVLDKTSSPVINFRIAFRTGAADDPKGKEGLAELTARMVADAGSKDRTYDQVQKALFPMAAGFGSQVDKELTVFGGRTHVDNLNAYYEIISGQLLTPGWREEDFRRIKDQLINEIRVSLRSNNDEELGKEVLYEQIYANHPYGHLTLGHVKAIEAITLDDVRQFYSQYYTRARLMLGLAGNVSDEFVERISADLATLPEGSIGSEQADAPASIKGRRLTIVQKDTRATAISIGFPIEVTRSHPDYAALWLVASYLGEHRSSNAYLYQRIRETRGLNYGDYAYIEYFPRGMFQFQPDPNLARSRQIFQVWIRPVVPENGHFALRIAMYELDRLIKKGLTKEEFEATRNFLLKNANVLTKSQDRQLGYELDSEFYGTAPFNQFATEALKTLTLADVNAAIRRHLQTENLQIVAITQDAQGLRNRVVRELPSPIKYDQPMSKEVLKEDATISRYPLRILSENVTVLPADRVFE